MSESRTNLYPEDKRYAQKTTWEPLSDDCQSWLIERMKKLGYVNIDGLCFGVSFMAVQAILAGELDLFDQRLKAIRDIPEDNFLDTINRIRNKQKGALLISEKDYALLEIPAFLDGIELYQNPNKHADLLGNLSNIHQDPKRTSPLLMSEKLASLGGIVQIFNATGIYDLSELSIYFKNFQDAAEQANPKLTQPVVFNLGSYNHAITISFDPNTRRWTIIDANLLPSMDPERLLSPYLNGLPAYERLAKMVNLLFSRNSITTFNTAIYTTPQHVASIANVVDAWRKFPAVQKMHEVTPYKARLSDSSNVSWLYMAAKKNELETVKKLIAVKADPIQANEMSCSPFGIALINEHVEVINALIQAGANPNQYDGSNTPLLSVVMTSKNLELLRELIRNKADVNMKSKDGKSPLLFAAGSGNSLFVKELIKAGAVVNDFVIDVKPANSNQVTTIGMARYKQYDDVVILLQLAVNYRVMLVCEPEFGSIRHQAIQKSFRDCFNANTVTENFAIYSAFKMLDDAADKLKSICNSYHSSTFFQTNNPKREASLNQLKQAVDQAYQSSIENKVDLNTILQTLNDEAGRISDETRADHSSSGIPVVSQLTRSRLAREIDTVVTARSHRKN